MAEKKFSAPKGCTVPEGAAADYESAKVFDRLRLGRLGAYYRDGFKRVCIPYGYMQRAFIRIQEVNGRLCCGNTTLAYYRLVFVRDGKEFAEVLSEKEEVMDAALEYLHQMAPSVAIGYVK